MDRGDDEEGPVGVDEVPARGFNGAGGALLKTAHYKLQEEAEALEAESSQSTT